MDIKKHIEVFLLDALKKKSIEKIRVNEIIEHVGTCKGTFYKYYADKYELLHRCLHNHFYADILDGATDWESFIMRCLTAFEKEPTMVRNAFCSGDINSIRYYHERLIAGFLEKDISNSGAQIGKVIKLAIRICAASYTDIMLGWLDGGMKESKEELLMYMCEAMPKSIDSQIYASA